MFPYEKYRYFTNNTDLVVAEQTFAGKKYRGSAKLGESDSFNLEDGKNLAAARCDVKICHQRYMQARDEYWALCNLYEKLTDMLKDAESYFSDSQEELEFAQDRLERIELKLGLTEEAKEAWRHKEKEQ